MRNDHDGGFTAAYLKLTREELSRKAGLAREILKDCMLCPRNCGVDRTSGEEGFCRTGDRPYVSSSSPHFGEERQLVGKHGSGTIFFARCNLGCLFCQNWTISHLGEGAVISYEELADIMLSLQDSGCHNINLVTPTHQVPMILRSLEIAVENGLRLPLVYNCGGYESVRILRILEGVVDIYMPDFKCFDPRVALKLSMAEDYPSSVMDAIREMHRQVGDLVVDERGIAKRGLIVRHLLLPEGLAGTEEVAKFLVDAISPDTYFNIMDQYYPCYRSVEHPPLDRRITDDEYKKAVKAAQETGLKRLD